MKKIVNIALIGTGWMGRDHSKAYALAPLMFPDISAVPIRKVVCDVNEELAKSAAEKFGYEEYSVSFDEIIKRDDIDIVDICAPTGLHADMVIKAMEAGKFVFCEKPLTTTKEDAERVREVMKKTNARTAIGLNKRRWPAVIYAKKIFEEGIIGKPLFYSGQYLQNGGLDKELYRGFRNSVAEGAGFADSTSHMLDQCRFLIGDLDEVIGTTDIYTTESIARPLKPGETPDDVPKVPRDSEDTVAFIARMKSGILARFFWSGCYSGAGEGISFEIVGEKGTIRWDGENWSQLQLSLETDRKDLKGFKTIYMGPEHPFGEVVPPLPNFGVGLQDCMVFQAYDIINAYVNGTDFYPNFEDGVRLAIICDAIRESTVTRSWVKVPD